MRTALTGDTTYNVNYATGNDANDGIVLPWKTIEHAADWTRDNLDLCGFSLIIKVADAQYNPSARISGPWVGCKGDDSVTIRGNPATPQACVIGANNSPAITFWGGARCKIEGFQVVAQGTNAMGLESAGASLIVGNMAYGYCDQAHIHSDGNGSILQAVAGSVHRLVGPCSKQFICAENQGAASLNNCTISVAASQNYLNGGLGFVNGDELAHVSFTGTAFAYENGSTVLGKQWAVSSGAVIVVSNALNTVPGSLPGWAQQPWQVV